MRPARSTTLFDQPLDPPAPKHRCLQDFSQGGVPTFSKEEATFSRGQSVLPGGVAKKIAYILTFTPFQTNFTVRTTVLRTEGYVC
jgi:hypothetical protein